MVEFNNCQKRMLLCISNLRNLHLNDTRVNKETFLMFLHTKKIPRKKGFLCMYWCSNFCSIKKYFHIFSVATTKKRQAINKSLRQKCFGYGVFRILDHYEFCCEVYFFSSSCPNHWSDVSWVLLDVIMTRDWTLKLGDCLHLILIEPA